MNLMTSKIHKYVPVFALSLIFFAAFSIFVLTATSTTYLVMKLFCGGIVAVTLSGILIYIFSGSFQPAGKWTARFRWEIIFVLCTIVVYFPLLTQNYLFYDDYWIFLTKNFDQVQAGLNTARPLSGIYLQLFDKLGFSNLYLAKWLAVAALILFGLIVMKWVYEKTQNKLISFSVAAAICFVSSVIDSVGYGATDTFTIGLAGAAFSVIAFDRFYRGFSSNPRLKSFLLFVLMLTSLLVGFYTHQLTAPVVFLMLAVELYYNKSREKLFKKDLLYTVFFGVDAIIFLESIKIFTMRYHIVASVRGQLVGSVAEIIVKIKYFFLTVLNQSFNQILDSVFGKSIFSSGGRIYLYVTPLHPLRWKIAMIAIVAVLVFAFFRCWFKNRRIIDIFVLLAFIPMSYFTMFILAETSYVSYYVVPLVALLTFLFVAGIFEICELAAKGARLLFKRDWKFIYLSLVLVAVIGFQGTYYISNFWVYYNRSGYDFIKNTIATKLQTNNWIHIYGVIYPGQGNVYSVFAAEKALQQLGVDPGQYKITTSDNNYYISIIQEDDFENILSKLDSASAAWLKSVYSFDGVYQRNIINLTNPSQKTLDRLRACFVQAGYIPANNSDATIVDLRWEYPGPILQ
jgi:hypothetical protein